MRSAQQDDIVVDGQDVAALDLEKQTEDVTSNDDQKPTMTETNESSSTLERTVPQRKLGRKNNIIVMSALCVSNASFHTVDIRRLTFYSAGSVSCGVGSG